jgi:hypothetical protein
LQDGGELDKKKGRFPFLDAIESESSKGALMTVPVPALSAAYRTLMI